MADTAPASIGGYKLNHTNKLEICTNDIKDVSKVSDPSTTWAQLAKGINNITFAENDTTANDEYYDGEGFGQSDVTSKRIQRSPGTVHMATQHKTMLLANSTHWGTT